MSLKAPAAMTLFLALVLGATMYGQTIDARLMSDADYKAFLSQVEAALPKWETALKGVDPEKIPHISYSDGKLFLDKRNLCLTEIGNIRLFVAEQRAKRTIYGELALKGFLDSLFDVGEEIVWEEGFNGLTLTSLEKYAPELGALSARIGADAMARVELLEKATTTSSAIFSSPGKTQSSSSGKSNASAFSNNRLKLSDWGNKSIILSDSSYVTAEGMWIMEPNTPGNALLFPEQVSITCNKSDMTCQEMTVTLGPTDIVIFIMGPDEKDWQINSWSADSLLASYGADTLAAGLSDRCYSHVLNMAFASRSVSTSDVPTHTKGCEAFKQTISYHLMRGEYYVDTTPGNDAEKMPVK